MRHLGRKLTLALALAAGAAIPTAASAEDAAPTFEAIQTDDGPRVLIAGVGIGTKYERAAERLGGDPLGAFFGSPGAIVRVVELEGVPCDFMATVTDGRVSGVTLWCRGEAEELERLVGVIGAVLAEIPAKVQQGSVAWGRGDELIASLHGEEEGSERVLVLTIWR